MTLVDAHAAAHAAGVTVRTIQRWLADDRLCRYDVTLRRGAHVNLDEVEQLARLLTPRRPRKAG